MTPERLADIRSRLDVDDLLAEVDRLLRWKSEATEVLNAWEKVWVAAGEPGRPGESKAKATAAEVDRLRAQAADSHHPVDPTHGRGGKTICACGNLSWPCPALASADEVQP